MMKFVHLGLLITGVLAGACSTPHTNQLVHEKDSICISGSFYIVGDTISFPWVKLNPNNKCSDKENMPSTYVNFDKVESFQPDCVCRYSAACRKKCGVEDICLNACTD